MLFLKLLFVSVKSESWQKSQPDCRPLPGLTGVSTFTNSFFDRIKGVDLVLEM